MGKSGIQLITNAVSKTILYLYVLIENTWIPGDTSLLSTG